MPKIPPLSPEKLIKILHKAGFRTIRQKNLHVILLNDKGSRIVIPAHSGRKVKPGLVRAIIKEAGMTREEFIRAMDLQQTIQEMKIKCLTYNLLTALRIV